MGRISENLTFKRLRETEIRPILQIRPILGNVRFFVTGPRIRPTPATDPKSSSSEALGGPGPMFHGGNLGLKVEGRRG